MFAVQRTMAEETSGVAVASCSLCPEGESVPLEYLSKEITVPGFDFVNDCQMLETVATVLQQNTDQCSLLQSIGTICGCPMKKHACHLCGEKGSNVAYGWRELGFLSSMDIFGGITPTCQLIEAGLHSMNATDTYCSNAQLMVADYCGCGSEPGSQPPSVEEASKCYLCHNQEDVAFPEKKIDIIGFPVETCGELAEASKNLFNTKFDGNVESFVGNMCIMVRYLSVYCGCSTWVDDPCPICVEEKTYQVPFPERRLGTHLTALFLGDMQVSCGVLAELAQVWSESLPQEAFVCKALQGVGTECGCAMPEQPNCEICAHPVLQELLDHTVTDVAPYDTITCGLVEKIALFLDDGEIVPLGEDLVPYECRIFRYAGYLCGCNNGLFSYWGADTRTKQNATIWTQRACALLSLIGSIAIILDIARSKKLSTKPYHQIILCLSFFDILSSISWGLGPLPTSSLTSARGIDVTAIVGEEDLVFAGSHGTDATCKAQGFLLHLGFTSILYNMVLSYFCKLSVVNGWRDKDFTRKYRALMLCIPAVIGTGLAMGAIPFITPSPVACTIGSYNDDGGWLKQILLFYVPFGPAFVYAPINTFYIYWYFRRRNRKANKWRFEARRQSINNQIANRLTDSAPSSTRLFSITDKTDQTKNPMEAQLLWQSFWYVCAFYCSYFVFVVAFALDGFEVEAYWFYIVLSIFTPMQGFFNR